MMPLVYGCATTILPERRTDRFLLGFGDTLALSAQTPKLRYTFRPDAAEMGRKAVEILLKYDVISRPPLDELVGGKFMER